MIQSNKLTAKGKRMIANYEDNIIVSSYYNFIIKQKMKELCMVCLVGLKVRDIHVHELHSQTPEYSSLPWCFSSPFAPSACNERPTRHFFSTFLRRLYSTREHCPRYLSCSKRRYSSYIAPNFIPSTEKYDILRGSGTSFEII